VLAQIGCILVRVEVEALYRSYGNLLRQLRLKKLASGGPNAAPEWQARIECRSKML
jgi:hypothetical protein